MLAVLVMVVVIVTSKVFNGFHDKLKHTNSNNNSNSNSNGIGTSNRI